MGKRSDFERAPRDFYPTPREAVLPLLPHLTRLRWFYEPCAGTGELVAHLEGRDLFCYGHSDITEREEGALIKQRLGDATCGTFDVPLGCHFITNPPWDRKLLHPIITNLSDQAPTWLLFDADWMHTRQSAPFMNRLRKIVSVGRVKWIPDSKMTGKDNCCWYLFDKPSDEPTVFVGRAL